MRMLPLFVLASCSSPSVVRDPPIAYVPNEAGCYLEAYPPCAEYPDQVARSPDMYLHARLSFDELLKLDDRALVFEAEQRALTRECLVGTAGLTPSEAVLRHLFWFEGETMNGGFLQFFGNASGNCAMETLTSLEELGDPRLIGIYRRVLARWPGSKPPLDADARFDAAVALDEQSETWGDLSRELFAFDSDPIVAAYIRKNAARMTLPPRL